MRAIDQEQIEGFPKKDELRTLFVEHEIQEREVGEDEHHYPIFNTDLSGTDWVVDYCNNVIGLLPAITKEQAGASMLEMGFGKARAADPGKSSPPLFSSSLLSSPLDLSFFSSIQDTDPSLSLHTPSHPTPTDMPVTTYSGGWKVKMQLVAATLINADVLMLDEPTGHLDVTNIAWLKDWLRSFLKGGGSIITTSHDSAFLEEMCTHIIDFQKKKLVMFRGNLKDFVDAFPEKKVRKMENSISLASPYHASISLIDVLPPPRPIDLLSVPPPPSLPLPYIQSYFTLTNEKVAFRFPEPGPLEGVKSLSKYILKMTGVSFQYPTRTTPTVMDINLEVSRVSRVAVIGPNGAGKSTAIKLLIGELTPSHGAITKHPNMRLAYVAQHAFFHLEKHLNESPAQYIMWRFAGNEDKESLEILNQKKDAADKEVIKYWIKDGTTMMQCYNQSEEKLAVEPELILNRHEDKKLKTKEYEVKWRGKSTDCNLWVKRDILLAMGAEKLVQKFDDI